MNFDRYWLLTWTTYGTWLPGDARGNVTTVKDGPGPRIRHNLPGTPVDGHVPELESWAEEHLKGPPIFLDLAQAEQILAQFHETTAHRSWLLVATAIMRNHIHVEVGVPGDPDPEVMLRDYKSYASRSLNRYWPRPASGTLVDRERLETQTEGRGCDPRCGKVHSGSGVSPGCLDSSEVFP